MYRKLLYNDLKNNMIQTLNIALFIMLSVAFLAAAGQLSSELILSMNQLFEKAQTPHLLQMHSGDLDQGRLENFVNSHEEIQTYQVLEFWNVDNSNLSINQNSLKESIYDNGFSTQSEKFDYLFDLSDNLIVPKENEVYVPLYYYSSGMAKVGDELEIKIANSKVDLKDILRLKIAGFVRDSQMNSSLSVSRRFIVHEAGLKKIMQIGDLEYLIEFMLTDTKFTSKIESAYNSAGLEANGPPFMSLSLFRIVNAFSDGISIMALLFISILVIAISLLCIRLTLLSKMEEEEKEISVLRAIGIELHVIKTMFLTKYLFIAAVSSCLGFALSFVIKIPFLMNMKMFFGESKLQWQSIAIALLLTVFVFLFLTLRMKRMARDIKNIAPILRGKKEKESFTKFPEFLSNFMKLAIGDLFARRGIYKNMVSVFILSVFVITVPMSMYRTVSDSGFIQYLGIGEYDIRVDLAQIDGKEEAVEAFLHQLSQDDRIQDLEVYTGKRLEILTDQKQIEKIWVDLGVQEKFHMRYIDGKAPSTTTEIALSRLKANDLEKKVGDELTLLLNGVPTKLKISGVYSDLTNGGKTARAVFQADNEKTIWKIIPIRLVDTKNATEFIRSYQTRYPFVKFSDVHVYTNQIFGNTIAMTKIISNAAFIASMVLVFLITFLFMHLLYLKDLSQNSLLKSIGFTNRYLFVQYFLKSSVILGIGLLLGYLLAFTVGEFLGSGILELIGVSGVRFIHEPIFTVFIMPISLWIITMFGTILGVMNIRKMNVSLLIKEDL